MGIWRNGSNHRVTKIVKDNFHCLQLETLICSYGKAFAFPLQLCIEQLLETVNLLGTFMEIPHCSIR